MLEKLNGLLKELIDISKKYPDWEADMVSPGNKTLEEQRQDLQARLSPGGYHDTTEKKAEKAWWWQWQDIEYELHWVTQRLREEDPDPTDEDSSDDEETPRGEMLKELREWRQIATEERQLRTLNETVAPLRTRLRELSGVRKAAKEAGERDALLLENLGLRVEAAPVLETLLGRGE